jgi:DNA sulfur modification protein DndB
MAEVKFVKKSRALTPPTPAQAPSYPALLIRQNEHRFYFATIPVDDLFLYCFVARRDEDPAAGFQRALSEGRADDIANYLSSGTGSIPTNIVLSAQDTASFKYERLTKSISFARSKGAFLVLDGQHRLWGYSKCSLRHRVPVAIYQNLSRQQETKLFIDINTTQRGVPAALLLDIKQLAAMESQKEQILRDLFDRFARDTHSPLTGKLSSAKSVAGKVSRVTFNKSVGLVLGSSHVSGIDNEMRYRLLLNYVRGFEAELRDKHLLFRSAFFEAMFDVFDDVLRATLATKYNAKVESLREVIRPLATLDFSGATPTKKTFSTAMRSTLHQSTSISRDML